MIICGLPRLVTELLLAILLLLGGVGCGGLGGIPAGTPSNNPTSVTLPIPGRPISLATFDQLTMLYQLELPAEVQPDIAIDPTKRWLILKNSTQLLFYNLNTLQDSGLRINCTQQCLLAFHPEPAQNQLLVGNQLYDLNNFGSPVFVYEPPAGYTPTAVAYNHDGSHLAIAYSNGLVSQIRIYRSSDHKFEFTIPLNQNTVSILAFNQDGKVIIANTTNSLELRTVATTCLLASCLNLTQPINGSAKSLVFTYSLERANGFLITDQGAIWQVTPAGLHLLKNIEPGPVALSPLNNLLVVSNQDRLRGYDLATASLETYSLSKQTVSSSPSTVQFSSDGSLLIISATDKNGQLELQIWGDQSLLPYTTLPANTACRQTNGDSVLVAFSTNGEQLVRGLAHCLEIWDITRPDTPTPIVNKSISDGLISHLLFQPNDQELAVVVQKSNGNELIFPISAPYQQVRLLHQGTIMDMVFMPTLSDGTQLLVTLENNPA